MDNSNLAKCFSPKNITHQSHLQEATVSMSCNYPGIIPNPANRLKAGRHIVMIVMIPKPNTRILGCDRGKRLQSLMIA